MKDPEYIRQRLAACEKEFHDQATSIIIDILRMLNNSIEELAREQLKNANEFRRALNRGNLLP